MRLPFALTLVLLVLPCVARTATLRGTVHVTGAVHDDPAFQPYAGMAGAMPHTSPARGQAGDAVFWLEALPAAIDSTLPEPARPKLAQKGQMFVPRVVVVAAGGNVDFPNLDPIYHNVFSVSPVRRFDLGKYPQGESRTVRFPKTGLVNVYCDIHSDMAAFILVVPNRAFTRPRPDGTWQLPPLPPGHYALRWWHPDLGQGRRDVDLGPEDDLVVDVSF